MNEMTKQQRDRYFNDPKFHALVDSLYHSFWKELFTKQELLEAIPVAELKIECQKEKEFKRNPNNLVNPPGKF